MSDETQLSLPILPERFDILERKVKKHDLKSIVVKVPDALNYIDRLYDDMNSAGRGAFLVFRGESGSGKSTFLRTLDLFKENVETYLINQDENVAESLQKIPMSNVNLRVLVIEGKEALTDFSETILEKELHAINRFIRSVKGEKTLVVWNCNTDDLQNKLIALAKGIGAESLLGIAEEGYRFSGPPKSMYVKIANHTLEVMNQNYSLIDFGISEEEADQLVQDSGTIGSYLSRIRVKIREKKSHLQSFLKDKEQCKVWTVVIAGNDPYTDTHALTQGTQFNADISRLMSSTNANVVEQIKAYPEQIALLAGQLDAKILHLPVLCALAIAKKYANKDLRAKMREEKMYLSSDPKVLQRLKDSDLAKAFESKSRGISRRGKPIGSNTEASFKKLTTIAIKNDILLNKAIGEALQQNGFITSFETEVEFIGNGRTLKSDLLCQTNTGPIRLEIMWRQRTSSAEISNYVLEKLYRYGQAIGLLQINHS